MVAVTPELAASGEHEPCCEFCGLVIEEDGQRCAALDDGECKTTEEVLLESGAEP